VAAVLGVIRLSNDTDTSTSPAGQRQQIEAWASGNGHNVIGWAEDTDVSARKVAPARRPQLSRWLQEPKLDEWDLLACAKQDRLFRSVADIGTMTKFCLDNGKTWHAIAEGTDLFSASGRAYTNMLATFGEFEADRIGERCRESADRLAATGRWRGGHPPYGYAAQERPGGGWMLIQDPEQAEILRRMAADAISGSSNGQIAAWLRAEKIATPRDARALRSGRDSGDRRWLTETIRAMLRSPSLAGHTTRRGKVVRDDDGKPVLFTTEPVLDDDTFGLLIQALNTRLQHRGERVGGHMLLRTLHCKSCTDAGSKPQRMYGHVRHNGNGHSTYRCPACGFGISMKRAESLVEMAMLEEVGSRKLPRRIDIPAQDHTRDLERIERLIAELDDALFNSETTAAAHGRMMKRYETERDRLSLLPQHPARTRYEPTDQIVREHWQELDPAERGRFLRNWHVQARADKSGLYVLMPWHRPGAEGAALAAAFGLKA
jgi:site-specific DNA recombinase